nr:hypothetical protein CFP56_78921 [Quercus suber]
MKQNSAYQHSSGRNIEQENISLIFGPWNGYDMLLQMTYHVTISFCLFLHSTLLHVSDHPVHPPTPDLSRTFLRHLFIGCFVPDRCPCGRNEGRDLTHCLTYHRTPPCRLHLPPPLRPWMPDNHYRVRHPSRSPRCGRRQCVRTYSEPSKRIT